MIFFIRKKIFLIVKKNFRAKKFLYRYIIRKIFLKISNFPIALCVNVCYYMIVAKITTQ